MSPTVALRNLYKDADFFGLTQLEEMLRKRLLPPAPVFSQADTAALAAYGFGSRTTLADLLSGAAELERDTSKHEEVRVGSNPLIPQKGESLAPLVLVQDVLIS